MPLKDPTARKEYQARAGRAWYLANREKVLQKTAAKKKELKAMIGGKTIKPKKPKIPFVMRPKCKQCGMHPKRYNSVLCNDCWQKRESPKRQTNRKKSQYEKYWQRVLSWAYKTGRIKSPIKVLVTYRNKPWGWQEKNILTVNDRPFLLEMTQSQIEKFYGEDAHYETVYFTDNQKLQWSKEFSKNAFYERIRAFDRKKTAKQKEERKAKAKETAAKWYARKKKTIALIQFAAMAETIGQAMQSYSKKENA
jgi:hypothetical protein